MSQPPAAVQSTMKAASERARNRARALALALSPGPYIASHIIGGLRTPAVQRDSRSAHRECRRCRRHRRRRRRRWHRWHRWRHHHYARHGQGERGREQDRRQRSGRRQRRRLAAHAAVGAAPRSSGAPRHERRRRRRGARHMGSCAGRAAQELLGASAGLAHRQAAMHPRPAPLPTPSPPLLPLPHPRRAPPPHHPPPRQAFSAAQLSTEACEAARRALPRASRTAVHKASRACGPLYDWTGAQLNHAEALQQARVHRACAAADMRMWSPILRPASPQACGK